MHSLASAILIMILLGEVSCNLVASQAILSFWDKRLIAAAFIYELGTQVSEELHSSTTCRA